MTMFERDAVTRTLRELGYVQQGAAWSRPQPEPENRCECVHGCNYRLAADATERICGRCLDGDRRTHFVR